MRTKNILAYSKEFGRHTFNSGDSVCRVPYSDISLAMNFNKVDDQRRRYKERKFGKKSYILLCR